MSYDMTEKEKARAEVAGFARQVAEVITKPQLVPLDTSFKLTEKHEPGKGIYAISKPVKRYKEAKDVADRMVQWLNTNNGRFEHIFKTAYAISHCQVAAEPLDMFVVAKELTEKNSIEIKGQTRTQNSKNFYFPAQAIFNARIIEAPEKIPATIPTREVTKKDGKVGSQIKLKEGTVTNLISVPDACMSFPKRTAKNTQRYYRIKVRYQVKGWIGFKTITEWVEGLKAHIFQHEIDHANAKNMYFDKTSQP